MSCLWHWPVCCMKNRGVVTRTVAEYDPRSFYSMPFSHFLMKMFIVLLSLNVIVLTFKILPH